MIEIVPAILTTDPDKLGELLRNYIEAGFQSVDIDIQEEGFADTLTVSVEDAVEVVAELEIPAGFSLGWDLKLRNPEESIDKINAIAEEKRVKSKTYVYHSANLAFLKNVDCHLEEIALALLNSDQVPELEELNHYPEVQIMTIEAENQGSKMSVRLLKRVAEIRELGYTGRVSIDGGVDLISSPIIREIASEYGIDKVSVGSFFQQSDYLSLDKQKLTLALNI